MAGRDIVNVVQLVTTVATSVALFVAATVALYYGPLRGLLVVAAWITFLFALWCIYTLVWLLVTRPWKTK